MIESRSETMEPARPTLLGSPYFVSHCAFLHRNLDVGEGSMAWKTSDRENVIRMVDHFQSLENITDSNARVIDLWDRLLRNAHSVVLDFDGNPILNTIRSDLDDSTFDSG